MTCWNILPITQKLREASPENRAEMLLVFRIQLPELEVYKFSGEYDFSEKYCEIWLIWNSPNFWKMNQIKVDCRHVIRNFVQMLAASQTWRTGFSSSQEANM